ncbi:MAG TPA: hypothetical protein VMT35_03080 [Ignavibacteriaceae bacterium]|nr:hypothetical protein [Ignavibacteriaceae bacterium]
MTVKNLIRLLKKCDMNEQVRIGTYCGTVEGTIKGIHTDLRSPSNKGYCVYLGCEMMHFKGERTQRTPKKVKK